MSFLENEDSKEFVVLVKVSDTSIRRHDRKCIVSNDVYWADIERLISEYAQAFDNHDETMLRGIWYDGGRLLLGDAFGHIVDGLAAFFVEPPSRPVTHADNRKRRDIGID